jgi:hypothetical protein
MIYDALSSDQLIQIEFKTKNQNKNSGMLWYDGPGDHLYTISSKGTKQKVNFPGLSVHGSNRLWEMYDFMKKFQEREKEIEELCKQHPMLKAARDEFDTLYALLKDR